MKLISVLALLALILQNVFGHSYLTNPIDRSNQRTTLTGCRYPSCGPCDSPTPSSPYTVSRGSSIALQWPRNNHPGGFVRIAWTSTSLSGSQSSFDAGVDSWYCFESPSTTCHSATSDPLGPDDNNQYNCGVNVIVPLWIPNGLYTLQWIWFGGIYFLGEYYSCVDYQVSGGPNGTRGTPVFRGGDAANPTNNSVCQFANTNTAHTCGEPCTGSWQPGGTPFNAAPNATYTIAGSTTGNNLPATTGSPFTTGNSRLTTGSMQLTTSSNNPGVCAVGSSRCNGGGQYQTCVSNYDAPTGTFQSAWGCNQNCPINTNCYQCSPGSPISCN